MRRYCFIVILLFSFIILFSSCTNASSYYEEGNYLKALELLKEKKGLTKDDYLMKINCLINLGKQEDAKESIMLYLLLSDETDDRTKVINMFADYDFSSVLTLLLLKDSDGINAQILRYIAFVELNEIDKAKEILANYLAAELSITQFATLIVAHPIDSDYTYSFFNAWFKVLQESDKNSFYSLFFYFVRSDISEDILKLCLKMMNHFESDSYFNESKTSLALLYKTEGIVCNRLHDTNNASIYWKNSYKLNPNDEEIITLLNDFKY